MASPALLSRESSAMEWDLDQLEQWAITNFEADFVALPGYNTLEFRQKLGMEGDNLSEVLIGHMHYSQFAGLEPDGPEDYLVWAGVETVMWVPEICFHVRKENATEHMRDLLPKVALIYPFSLASKHTKDRETYIWSFVWYYLLSAGLVEKVPLQVNLVGELRDFRKDFRRACENFRRNLTAATEAARQSLPLTAKAPISSAPPPVKSPPPQTSNSHSLSNILGAVGHKNHHKRKREDVASDAVKKEAIQINEALRINDEDPETTVVVAKPQPPAANNETAVVPSSTLQQERERFQDVRYHQQQMDRYLTKMEDENDILKREVEQIPALQDQASQLPEKNAMIAELQDLNNHLSNDLTDERETRAREMDKSFRERTQLQITVNELVNKLKEKEMQLNERGKETKQLQKERDSYRAEAVNLNQTNIQIKMKAKEQQDAAVMEERSLRMKAESRALDAQELLKGVPSKIARAVSVLQGGGSA